MRKILVTGGAGLIGSNFTKYLCDKGYQVFVMDDLSGGFRSFVDPRATFLEINVCDSLNVDRAFSDFQFDYVYHFAAMAAEVLSHNVRRFNYENNILGYASIVNASIKYNVKKIVVASSFAVYGHQVPPFTEETTPIPEDPYGVAKLAMERDLEIARKFFGLRYSIVRPHNVTGINQNIWDKYRNVIGIWSRQILEGKDLTIYGDGLQVRAFSDVQFLLEPMEKLMDSFDGEIFNIGADREISILDAANLLIEISKKYGHKPSLKFLEARKEAKFAFCDHKKAKEALGFNDQTDLEGLFSQVFAWAKGQPSRPVKTIEPEITQNLYSAWK